MKKITATELKSIVDQHKLWLDGNGGIRANLTGANLEGANLGGANLWGANLSDANLYGANLTGANLTGADLEFAKLKDADLTGTILEKKAEKPPEVVLVKQELNIRSEFEALAKKHGMKVASLTLELL
jgi:hypothetical protein